MRPKGQVSMGDLWLSETELCTSLHLGVLTSNALA